jgi:hypothetical protein
MKFRMMLGCGLAALLAISTAAYAADTKKADDAKQTPKADTKTTEAPPITSSRSAHVVKPYSDLKDLSTDQEAKLKSIHARFAAEMSELKAKEKDESMAVLSDDQKKELVEVTAKLAAEKKVAAASAKAEKASSSSK